MSIFHETLKTENAGLDLCMRIAAREIAIIERKRGPYYEHTDADRARNAERSAGLKAYIRECGQRKELNLEAMESGKCLSRIHDAGKIDFGAETNRPRDYAAIGEWKPRQFMAGPEPYQPLGLADIDQMIARIENELDVLTRTEA